MPDHKDSRYRWQVPLGITPSKAFVNCTRLFPGPSLQRASSVSKATTPVKVILELDLPPEVPTGFTGRIDLNGILPTASYAGMAKEYLDKVPISLNVSGCPGYEPFAIRIKFKIVNTDVDLI